MPKEGRERNNVPTMELEGRSVKDGIYCFLVTAMLLSALFISLFLAFYGSRYSYYSQRDYSQLGWVEDTLWLHLGLFFAAVVGTGILSCLLRKLDEKIQKRIGIGVLLFACAWILIVWSFYVRVNPYYPEGDQLNTTAMAYYIRQGNFSMLYKSGYIGMHQQQKGLMFLYEILFSVFGDFAYGEAKQIHVLLGVAALVSGYFFLRIHTKRVLPGILFCVFLMFCMPFMLHMPYIYGDIPSISLSMVVFWALSAYGKNGRKLLLVIAAILAGCALLCRMNTWIILIAIAIGLLLHAWKKQRWRFVLAAVLMLFVAEGAVKAVDVIYEVRSGYESGVGIPGILYIAMGLQETDGMPGVYNRYHQTVFEENGFEQEPAAEVGREYIRSRLQELSREPEVMVDFFKRKLQGQWFEPLYESLYSTRSFDDEKPMPDWIEALYYGELHDIIWKCANYYQSIVYLVMVVYVAGSLFGKGKMQVDGTFWIPLIAIVGGFLFSIIWESQCRYVMPYYVFMLLYVPLGLEKGANGLIEGSKKLPSLLRKGKEKMI